MPQENPHIRKSSNSEPFQFKRDVEPMMLGFGPDDLPYANLRLAYIFPQAFLFVNHPHSVSSFVLGRTEEIRSMAEVTFRPGKTNARLTVMPLPRELQDLPQPEKKDVVRAYIERAIVLQDFYAKLRSPGKPVTIETMLSYIPEDTPDAAFMRAIFHNIGIGNEQILESLYPDAITKSQKRDRVKRLFGKIFLAATTVDAISSEAPTNMDDLDILYESLRIHEQKVMSNLAIEMALGDKKIAYGIQTATELKYGEYGEEITLFESGQYSAKVAVDNLEEEGRFRMRFMRDGILVATVTVKKTIDDFQKLRKVLTDNPEGASEYAGFVEYS